MSGTEAPEQPEVSGVIAPTAADFESSGWEKVIDNAREHQCSYYCWELWKEARDRENSGDETGKRLFQLLGDVTSMRFGLDAPDQPFGPQSSSGDRRTATAEDFESSQLFFFASVVANISDPELRARLADVLWLRQRDYRMGELAISSYLESAQVLEDPQHWNASAERIERALQLAVMIGRKTSAFAKVIEHIETVLTRLDGNDPYYFSAQMMRLLLERRVGDPQQCIALAEKLASTAETTQNWDVAREYLSLKAKWHLLTNDPDGDRAARVREAESYVKQSETHLQGTPPSFTLASHWLQQAIEAFRRVGNCADRIQELHAKLLEYQEQSTSELRTVSTSIDLTEVAEKAAQQVSGKSLLEALISLALLANPKKKQKLRQQAEINRKKYIGQSLFPKVYLNALGRVIARQPHDAEESLIADMHGLANHSRSICAQGVIEPARQQLISEHNPRVQDFVSILENNRLVPPGREVIIARGLHAGLNGDLLVAAHLLIPQIEESIRFVLAQVGVITSAIDDQGVQDEYNINRMLSAEKYTGPLDQLFGEDLVFDMRGLLVERFGANLRNTLAHALVDHNVFYTAEVCYAWWLALRFYLLPEISKSRSRQEAKEFATD